MAPPAKKSRKSSGGEASPAPAQVSPPAGSGLARFFGSPAAKQGAGSAVTTQSGGEQPGTLKQLFTGASPAAPQAAAQSSGTLSEDQRQRIEENRRLAMERQQAKKREREAAEGAAKVEAPVANPKAKAKGKGRGKGTQATSSLVENTPEKTRLPPKEKRQTPESARSLLVKPEGGAQSEWEQYAAVYVARLSQLRGGVEKEARATWGSSVAGEGFRAEISAFRQCGNTEVVVCGILFKELKGRFNILDQYRNNPLATRAAEDQLAAMQPGAYCTDDDTLWLEDTSMRVKLVMAQEEIARLVTGLVVSVKGVATSDGDLQVTGIISARLPPPPPLQRTLAPAQEGPFIALVSGLALNGATDQEARARLSEARLRLLDFVAAGTLRLQRLIVCGGVLSGRELAHGERLTKEELADVDELLTKLAAATPLEVMPGRTDPTNLSLPQTPLHPHLFKQARRCQEASFKCVGNPYTNKVEGFSMLGHSGQPVQDFLRCTRGVEPLDALQRCLEGLHLAPTAPDTLAVPAFTGRDPLVIQETPHVFFAGGQRRAEHRWFDASQGGGDRCGTQLVCVPAFHLHPAVVLVNVRDPRDVRVQELGPPVEEAATVGVAEAAVAKVQALEAEVPEHMEVDPPAEPREAEGATQALAEVVPEVPIEEAEMADARSMEVPRAEASGAQQAQQASAEGPALMEVTAEVPERVEIPAPAESQQAEEALAEAALEVSQELQEAATADAPTGEAPRREASTAQEAKEASAEGPTLREVTAEAPVRVEVAPSVEPRQVEEETTHALAEVVAEASMEEVATAHFPLIQASRTEATSTPEAQEVFAEAPESADVASPVEAEEARQALADVAPEVPMQEVQSEPELA